VISGPTTIGEDNRIHQFASVGDVPQDKKYKGEPTRLEIGHRNIVREFTTLNCGAATGQHGTRIATTTCSWRTRTSPTIASSATSVLVNCATLAGHVVLGDWVISGGFSAIHQFCKIGAHAFLRTTAQSRATYHRT
jgi:UDP-N-acetylglucosamine acyltransferase